MIQRCENKNDKDYSKYGGRGISIYNKWHAFEEFRDWSMSNGYDDTLSIDRVDVDADYCPQNCRWTSCVVQQNNKRNNRLVTYAGITHTIAEWSRILDVNYQTLIGRINRNDMRDFKLYFNIQEYV